MISNSERGGVTVDSVSIDTILVMHCAFLSGRHGTDLHTSISLRHFLMISDNCSLVWDGNVPLDEEGPFP